MDIKFQTQHVLDHGEVRLVDYQGGDLAIVRSARVSYDAEWRAGESSGSDRRLINYLMTNNHTTPFESTTFTFYVKAPIFVFRQWHRHRTQSYNEASARYTELPDEFYVPHPDQITTQSKDNKQMRTNERNENAAEILDCLQASHAQAYTLYKLALSKGCPRELARSVLPVATYSKMFTTLNLHNLFHFLRLRLHSHAQYEIRVYAEAMLKITQCVAPVAVQAFKDTLNLPEEEPAPEKIMNQMVWINYKNARIAALSPTNGVPRHDQWHLDLGNFEVDTGDEFKRIPMPNNYHRALRGIIASTYDGLRLEVVDVLTKVDARQL